MKTCRLALWALLIAAACCLSISERGYCIGEEALEIENPTEPGPWFTGTLLSPSGYVVPLGYASIEPYIFAVDNFAVYNGHWKSHSIPRFWSVSLQTPFWIGIADWADLVVMPQVFWNETQGRSATHFGDFPVGIDIQLLKEKKGSWQPAMKLSLRETFPTGKYQKLNPHKLGTDASGTGSFVTTIGLAIARLFHIHKDQYFNPRIFFSYSIPSSVHVKGFNTFGGGFGTRGTVYPGYFLTAIVGMEYSLTRNWALALDIMNIYFNKTRFKGFKGMAGTGTSFNPLEGVQTGMMGGLANVGAPSADQVSLAPAIEYNFSEWLGVIGGCWFTVAGRNTPDFVSGVLAVSWYFHIGKKKPGEAVPVLH